MQKDESQYDDCNSIIKNRGHQTHFNVTGSKLKLRAFLRGCSVAMVTYRVGEIRKVSKYLYLSTYYI